MGSPLRFQNTISRPSLELWKRPREREREREPRHLTRAASRERRPREEERSIWLWTRPDKHRPKLVCCHTKTCESPPWCALQVSLRARARTRILLFRSRIKTPRCCVKMETRPSSVEPSAGRPRRARGWTVRVRSGRPNRILVRLRASSMPTPQKSVSIFPFLTRNSAVSSPIWTIDRSNDSSTCPVAFSNTFDRPHPTLSSTTLKHQT